MMRLRTFLIVIAIPIWLAIVCGGCIYTSRIIFPDKNTALYCFKSDTEGPYYIYKINLRTHRAALKAEFEKPVYAIALSEDKKTFFYYEYAEKEEATEEDSETSGTLSLKMLPLEELGGPTKAKVICSLDTKSGEDLWFGSSFGAMSVVPLMKSEIAFLNYMKEDENIPLVKVDLKSGEVTSIVDDGIAVYPKLSPNGKYLGYVSVDKPGKEDEDKGQKCTLVVLETGTLKEIEKKDLGEWDIPPQFAFLPSIVEGYKILSPKNSSEPGIPIPKGVSVDMHYLDSMQYIAGENKLAIYGHNESKDEGLVEIANLEENILETFNLSGFLPLAWSPDDKSFFLGNDDSLAQYLPDQKSFIVYMFESDDGPRVYSTRENELPGKTEVK